VCTAHPVRVEALDDLVWEQTCKLLAQPELVLQEYTHRAQKKQRQSSEVAALLAKKKRELKQQEVEKERLLDLYQTGHVGLPEIEPRLKSIRAKIKKLHDECALVEKETKEEHHRLQLIEQFAVFAQRMNTNLSTLGFAERKHLVRLLVEEVIVNTSTEEITVRHILPVDQTFPLCKRSKRAALRRPFVTRAHQSFGQYARFEVPPEEGKDALVLEPLLYFTHQPVMVDSIKRAITLMPPSRTQFPKSCPKLR